MQTSDKGISALKAEEGEVLKAYLCPANRWTIGVGLTAASGVVKPKAGMVITREQSSALLAEALRRNYEPAVEVAMARFAFDGTAVIRPAQHEFDAGVSFHFNTGAIRKASWVKIWINLGKPRGSSPDDVRRSLMQWVKGGGKVLPGLVARRKRDAAMLLEGVYYLAHPVTPPQPGPVYATWALKMDTRAFANARAGFTKLGYDVGPKVDQVLASSVREFQGDHALTVDGIIGRATLSTLQRRLDAPAAAAKPAVAAPFAAATQSDVGAAYVDGLGVTGAEWVAIGLVALWGLHTAWRYRDVIAAKIARLTPRFANLLRSF